MKYDLHLLVPSVLFPQCFVVGWSYTVDQKIFQLSLLIPIIHVVEIDLFTHFISLCR